jgi:hypothetical protein
MSAMRDYDERWERPRVFGHVGTNVEKPPVVFPRDGGPLPKIPVFDVIERMPWGGAHRRIFVYAIPESRLAEPVAFLSYKSFSSAIADATHTTLDGDWTGGKCAREAFFLLVALLIDRRVVIVNER